MTIGEDREAGRRGGEPGSPRSPGDGARRVGAAREPDVVGVVGVAGVHLGPGDDVTRHRRARRWCAATRDRCRPRARSSRRQRRSRRAGSRQERLLLPRYPTASASGRPCSASAAAPGPGPHRLLEEDELLGWPGGPGRRTQLASRARASRRDPAAGPAAGRESRSRHSARVRSWIRGQQPGEVAPQFGPQSTPPWWHRGTRPAGSGRGRGGGTRARGLGLQPQDGQCILAQELGPDRLLELQPLELAKDPVEGQPGRVVAGVDDPVGAAGGVGEIDDGLRVVARVRRRSSSSTGSAT